VAWIGYDQPRPMGGSETGSVAALPMWMHYMGEVLRDVPDQGYSMPTGIAVIRVDPLAGTPVEPDAEGMAEFFYEEFTPGTELPSGLVPEGGMPPAEASPPAPITSAVGTPVSPPAATPPAARPPVGNYGD
jgi:penicillin-binding protein 1A